MEPYKNVSCEFYDNLEMYAVQKRKIDIAYTDGEEVIHDVIKIKTLQTKNKEEFLVTDKGLVIRLDNIVSLAVIK